MEIIDELVKIFLYAMTPIGELRLAIPIGITHYNVNFIGVYIIAVLGNIIPPFVIIYFAPKVTALLRGKSKKLDKLFDWVFDRTRKKTKKYIEKYGALGLMLFVAIPLPNTGAWTGSIAAWLFGVEKKIAIKYTIFGILIAGFVVTLLTFGVQNSIN